MPLGWRFRVVYGALCLTAGAAGCATTRVSDSAKSAPPPMPSAAVARMLAEKESRKTDQSPLPVAKKTGDGFKPTAGQSEIIQTSHTVVDSNDAESPHAAQAIDMATALHLAAGQNPQVAFAQERIQEALASIDR